LLRQACTQRPSSREEKEAEAPEVLGTNHLVSINLDNINPKAAVVEVEVLRKVEVQKEEVEVEEAGVPGSLMAGGPHWEAESLQQAGHNMRHQTSVASLGEFGCPNSKWR
jgi:hypothetical protein